MLGSIKLYSVLVESESEMVLSMEKRVAGQGVVEKGRSMSHCFLRVDVDTLVE